MGGKTFCEDVQGNSDLANLYIHHPSMQQKTQVCFSQRRVTGTMWRILNQLGLIIVSVFSLHLNCKWQNYTWDQTFNGAYKSRYRLYLGNKLQHVWTLNVQGFDVLL